VTTPLTLSLGRQLSELAAFIRREFEPGSADGLFTLHVFEAVGESGPVSGWPPAPPPDALRCGQAPALAAAAYLLTHQNALRPADAVDGWRSGLKRLSAKNAFPADRQTFAHRPLELYGLSLGARHLLAEPAEELQWLRDVARRLEPATPADFWGAAISRLASSFLGVTWSSDWPALAPNQPISDFALLRWAAVAHASLAPPRLDLRSLDADILGQATVSPLPCEHPARAAVLYQAVRAATHERLESDLAATWQVSRPNRDAVELVTTLCRRFPLFAKQVQVRREKRKTITFTDEYDVQDAMHALLRLFFDDVRAEEVAPSYAGNSSRIDFLLKREKVVVEVKMTRHNLKQQEVASQLIEDKERYCTHPDCRALVCFVYDPDGHIANPASLEADVSQEADGLRVVAIVAPKGT
jgi:hypothetical protein